MRAGARTVAGLTARQLIEISRWIPSTGTRPAHRPEPTRRLPGCALGWAGTGLVAVAVALMPFAAFRG